MTCRECGTEIADKAIVCFRCGAPTFDPATAAKADVPDGRVRSGWLLWLLPVLMGAAGVLLFDDAVGRAAGIAAGILLAIAIGWARRRGRTSPQRVG